MLQNLDSSSDKNHNPGHSEKLKLAKSLPQEWPDNETKVSLNFITDTKYALEISALIYECVEEGIIEADINIKKAPYSVTILATILVPNDDMFIRTKQKRDSLIRRIKKKLLEYVSG